MPPEIERHFCIVKNLRVMLSLDIPKAMIFENSTHEF